MKNITFLLILTLLGISQLSAQPHLSGDVYVDMNKGYWECKFTVSNLPELENYKILLNKGMNIKYFKDASDSLMEYQGFYEGPTRGEAIEYYLGSEEEKSPLPGSFQVEYVGAFPVYDGEYNDFDFKGFIANNGKTMRASEQTKWYPIIYDADNDRLIDKYAYEINVTLDGGSTIFINGDAPQKSNKGVFSSGKAVPILIFLGNFEFIENKGNYILNDSVSEQDFIHIQRNADLIKSTLKDILKSEFNDNIYFLKHEAVNKRKKGSSWGFNTYPTFAFTGINFSDLVEKDGKFSDNMTRFFGHEFAHNFFGNNVMSGKLYWFWLESFPEYLSFRIADQFAETGFLKDVYTRKIERLKDADFIALDKIESPDQINDMYRYHLAPLLLKCFELKFGKDKLDRIMQTLLKKSHSQTLSLKIFESIALEAGIDEAAYQQFAKKFISSPNFKDNIIEFILKTYGE